MTETALATLDPNDVNVVATLRFLTTLFPEAGSDTSDAQRVLMLQELQRLQIDEGITQEEALAQVDLSRATLAYWRKTKPYLFNLATMLTLASQDDEVDAKLLSAWKKGIDTAIELMEESENDAVRLKALTFLQRYYFDPMAEQLQDLEGRVAEQAGAEAASKKRKATNFQPVQVLVQVTQTADGRPIPAMEGMEGRSSLEDFAVDDDVIGGEAEVID